MMNKKIWKAHKMLSEVSFQIRNSHKELSMMISNAERLIFQALEEGPDVEITNLKNVFSFAIGSASLVDEEEADTFDLLKGPEEKAFPLDENEDEQ